jgi:SAM-dependent MidA family methyltransferase
LRSERQNLPTPDEASLIHSSIVLEELAKKINTNEGWINFADFMQFILYEPGLGYYSSGTRKLGTGGDFTTAPEISNFFGTCLADSIIKILHSCPKQMILEIGAGSGQLCKIFMMLSARHVPKKLDISGAVVKSPPVPSFLVPDE